jgi:hypothetical protein
MQWTGIQHVVANTELAGGWDHDRPIPPQLIDVGVKSDNTWRLRLDSGDTAEPPGHLTRSYRWPKKPPITLLSSLIGK